VEAVRLQLGNICAHWSTCHQRRHPTSSHRCLWPHLTRSSFPSFRSRRPPWQMDRPNPKRTCRPLEPGPWTRSSWMSDATAHAGYAMMMMMTNI